jgi:hypothetical protein
MMLALRYGHIAKIARLTPRSRKAYKLIREHANFVKKFEEAFYQYAYVYYDSANILINSYSNKSVKHIKVSKKDFREEDPILLCAVKNDLKRIKLQVEHHRKIGVKHFAYIDNASTDGTFEWLVEQPDVSLFSTNETFNSKMKDSWIRQVTDFLGYNRWYLTLDSDELFIYPGVETKNINEYIYFLEKLKIKSTFSPMIDMYSNGKLFEKGIDVNGIFNTYCYFDTDTYKKEKQNLKYHVAGGPRTRLFSTNENPFMPSLEKYALIKLSENMLKVTHEIFPYNHNFYTNGAIAFLLHYKFLSDDDKTYKEHADSGLYFNGSVEYKRYLSLFEQNKDASFYYDKSQRLNDSTDLMKINIVDREFFKKFGA